MTPTPSTSGEREAFEAHWLATRGSKRARRELVPATTQPQVYIADSANRHWVTWQAARASLASPAASAGEPASELIEIARAVEALKRECGMDPESPIAIQNSRYMTISYRLRALAASTAAPAIQWIGVDERLPEAQMPVLLDIGKKYPIRAMWVAAKTLQAFENDNDFGEYSEEDDEWYCPAGWYEWNEHEETHWAVTGVPVAWSELPLPTPPAAPERDAG